MSAQALRRIQLIFQTEVRILKYSYPGLSYFSLEAPRPLMEYCTRNPNCLLGLESVDSMKIGRLPLQNNNNLRMVYLSILIMAYEEPQPNLLRRVKNFAYDESCPITCFPLESIPEQFRLHFEDKLFRKLFVQFFHLVGCRKSSNKVTKFLELHPILDLAFVLLFKRLLVGCHPSATAFTQRFSTVDIIGAIFQKFELTPQFVERRLRLGPSRYLAEDQGFTYLTCSWQDDIDMDFTEEISESESDQETEATGNPESTTKFSLKGSHCSSSQTKVTLEEQSNTWVTPQKEEEAELMFQSVVIPSRPHFQTGFVKSPTSSETEIGKVASLGIEEVQVKCGEIKNKLRKLESDVQNFNNPNRNRNQGLSTKVFLPIAFKERQSEKKCNSECETTFVRNRIVSEAPSLSASNGISSVAPLSKAANLNTIHFPKKAEAFQSVLPLRQTSIQQLEVTKLTRENCFSQMEQSSVQRTNPTTERSANSKGKTLESEVRGISDGNLFLKENPKRIFVRKI